MPQIIYHSNPSGFHLASLCYMEHGLRYSGRFLGCRTTEEAPQLREGAHGGHLRQIACEGGSQGQAEQRQRCERLEVRLPSA